MRDMISSYRSNVRAIGVTRGAIAAVRARSAETKKKYFAADVMVPAAIWLASEQSNNITGCRYIGSKWQDDLPPEEAAEAAREPAIFLPPKRDSVLAKPWTVP